MIVYAPTGAPRESRTGPKRMLLFGRRCRKAMHGERKRLHELVGKA